MTPHLADQALALTTAQLLANTFEQMQQQALRPVKLLFHPIAIFFRATSPAVTRLSSYAANLTTSYRGCHHFFPCPVFVAFAFCSTPLAKQAAHW